MLQRRVEEIIHILLSEHHLSDDASSTTNNFPLDAARQVFNPQNLQPYISAYFRYFHPHFTSIHRPTFDIHRASLPLIDLGFALAGSANSPPTDDALSAPCLHSVAEAYVFRCLHDVTQAPVPENGKVIGIVQAAVLMNALSYSLIDQATAQRYSIHRSRWFVSAVRRLNLLGMRRTIPL